MPRQFSPRGIAEHFAKLAAGATVKEEAVLLALADNTVGKQRAIIGDPNRLQPLKDDTLAEHERMGVGDTPLYERGNLRESITAAVGPGASIAGSTSPVMRYHEFGTVRDPVRAPIAAGAVDAIPETIEILRAGAKALGAGDDGELLAWIAKARAAAGSGAAKI